MNILDEIVASKKRDNKVLKDKLLNIRDLDAHDLSTKVDLLVNNVNKVSSIIKEKKYESKDISHKNLATFYELLKTNENFTIIGEVKRGSPSKGYFAKDLSVSNMVQNYIDADINCISVLTNNEYFYGSYRDLYQVRNSYSGFILNKEFIIDEIQIDIAKLMGANIILLIKSVLSKEEITRLYNYAYSNNLEVIVEVHSKEELFECLDFNPKIVGVNNRNLKTFKTDILNSLIIIENLKKSLLEDIVFISESGISTKNDIERLKNAGFKGALIGEAFIKDFENILDVTS